MWTIQLELKGGFHFRSAGLVWSQWPCPCCPDGVAMHLLSSTWNEGENTTGAGPSSAASPGCLPGIPLSHTALPVPSSESALKLGSNSEPDLSDTLHLPTALLSHPCSTGAPNFVKRAGMPQWLPRLYQPVAVTLAQLAPMTDHPVFELFQIILGGIILL